MALCLRPLPNLNARMSPGTEFGYIAPTRLVPLSRRLHVNSLTKDSAHSASDSRPLEPKSFRSTLIKSVKSTLGHQGCMQHDISTTTQSRLDYNRQAILETFKMAKHTDFKVTGNTLDCANSGFVRFDGDHELEYSLHAKDPIPDGTTIVHVPIRYCISLESLKSQLYYNFLNVKKSLNNDKTTQEAIEHTECLLRLSRGANFNFKNYQIFEDSYETFDKGHKQGYCDALNDEFCNFKRLQLLQVLTLVDTVLETNNDISKALESKVHQMADLNPNERETCLLTIAMVGEYFIQVCDLLLASTKGVTNFNLKSEAHVQLAWMHHLLHKQESHLLTSLPKEALESLQSTLIRFRVIQRKLACSDIYKVLQDPLGLVQDRIEHVSQSHYKIEDSMPIERGCGPITDHTRKIQCEEGLERIEALLLDYISNVETNECYNLFEMPRKYLNNPNESETSRGSLSLEQFVEHVLLHQRAPKEAINANQLLQQLAVTFNEKFITKAMSTIIAHIVRIHTATYEDIAEKYQHEAYLCDSCRGISCNFQTNNSNPTNQAYIVPLVDLCNHKSMECNAEIVFDEGFQLKAKGDISVHAELTLDYGDFDNNNMLLDYGFSSPYGPNNSVLMEIEPEAIRALANELKVQHLIPTYFPLGLPKEKMDALTNLNLLKMPSNDLSLVELYRDPHFEGVPVMQYAEFNQKFMARETDHVPVDDSEGTSYIPPDPIVIKQESDDKMSMNHIQINEHGIPDYHLMLLLKISFCKRVKRLEWIQQQMYAGKAAQEYLATSVNSSLDATLFNLAAKLCSRHIDQTYKCTIGEDLKVAHDPELLRLAQVHSKDSMSDFRVKTGYPIPNAMLIMHALRLKTPIYKCTHFYKSCAAYKKA